MFNSNASNRKIYVPTASVDAYKSSTYWSDYANYIVGYDFEDVSGELITFTVGGAEYQAEEGMTWGEWVETNYNTSGYYCNSYSNSINMGPANIASVSGDGLILPVSGDDLIINDASYILYDPT
jgi:hypothetical protein